MRLLWRILLIVLGVIMMGAAGFGGLSATLRLGDIGHAQQGLCDGFNPAACSALEAEQQSLYLMLFFSSLGFMGGLAAVLYGTTRGARRMAESPWFPIEHGLYCPSCGRPMVWVGMHDRWYCVACARYL